MKSILYLGCPPVERSEISAALAASEVSVVWADNVAGVLAQLQRRDMPVLLDLLRGVAALQSAKELRSQRGATLMLAAVDPRRPELTTEAVLAGVADVFARPLRGANIARAIDRELTYQAAQNSDERPHANGVAADNLYCLSNPMREVASVATRAAATRAGVMIRGEQGSGRQLLARSIHHSQSGKVGPFVTIDCAAFDVERFDARLFGTPPRSQNGEAPRGLEWVSQDSALYEAREGTIYFQNIAELPTRVQARLARLFRDREALVTETGQAMALDVRPMIGVDPSADTLLREGRIREDLFRRLSVIRVEMPALNKRREDIPALANYFVRQICASRRLQPKALSRPALSLIMALPWRGNAVEMRALLEGIISSASSPGAGPTIGLDEVLAHVRLDGGSAVFAKGGTLRQARAQFERDYIVAVLEQHRGRITEAAKTLGIQRTNLYRKMRSLKVNHRAQAY